MTRRRGRHTAPVFIVGSPRSGTTWLYHMLLSAGDVAVYRAEASVFNLLGPRFGDLAKARNRAALLDAWLPSVFFRRSGLDPEAFRARVEAHCRTPGEFTNPALLSDFHAFDRARLRARPERERSA